MRVITFAIVAAGFAAVAGSAAAAASDMDYLKANRCRGLAEGNLASIDTNALDAYLKAEKKTRTGFVLDRARNELDKAKREAKTDSGDRKARLVAELTGPCQVYKG